MTPFSIALRHSRRLSTAASTVAAAKPMSISRVKTKLKYVRDPDEAIEIYNSFIAGNDPSISTASVRQVQEYTVRLLAKANRHSDIETFLESHKSSSHISQEYFLSSLIRCYGAAGMSENALKMYEQMDEFGTPRSSLSFNAILWAFSHSSLYDRVITYFHEFPAKFGFSPDKFSYGILIKAHCEMGSPDIAIDKLNEMQGKGFELNSVVFTTIYHSLNTNGRIEEAESFWDEMVNEKGLKPDISAYNVKLNHVRHGDEDGLRGIVEEIKERGMVPDTITYNHIIKFYCENGLLNVAKRAYDEMLMQKGCNPSLATFKTLVFHCCKIGRFVSAYKIFKKSVEQHKLLDFVALQWLAEGLAKKGHKYEAKSLIRIMKKRSPPNSLGAWDEVAKSLDLNLDETEVVDSAPDGTEEVHADEVETGDSDKTEVDSDSTETLKC